MFNLGCEGVDVLGAVGGYVGRVGQEGGVIVRVDLELGTGDELWMEGQGRKAGLMLALLS